MRTIKHKLIIQKEKDIPSTELSKLMDVMYAYQFEKNYFSDQLLNWRNLLNRSHEDSASASLINLQSSYVQIRDKLVKDGYQSKYNLPARLWKMALKEAYDLHIRTHEAQVVLIKRNLNNNLYQYCHFELIERNKIEQNKLEEAELSIIQSFENFLYFATNSWFFNFKTFCQFEAKYFSKKFHKARVYQRAKILLMDLLKPSNAVKKEVLTKEEAKQLKQLLESGSNSLFNLLFQHYCHSLVKAIQKFRGFKQIQSQINPTITLDGDCYDLYSKYDSETKKNRWFLDIMSMESGKRIKGLELTGFHHAKQIMKHRKSANLTISFDPNNLKDSIAVHFTFPVRKAKLMKKLTKNKKHKNKKSRSQKAYVSKKQSSTVTLPTATTVGGDFGLTECFTFSDGWVVGANQGEMLREITEYTTQVVKTIQKHSKKGYFGVEKNNIKCTKRSKKQKGTKYTKGKKCKNNKRNHKNNCFNHNSELKNVNRHYKKQQEKYNSRLENYKYQFVNEIIDHFTSDNIYGQYATTTLLKTQPIQLVFEDLDFVSLGYTKEQKRQINLIKGVLTLLEEKIKLHNLPIEIIYVNPAYTSQTCPNCGFVARKNRDYQARQFRCQHCGFTANDDVRYRLVSEFVRDSVASGEPAKAIAMLPSADDYIASQNIAMRPSVLQDSQRLRVRKIKELLLARHEQAKIKGSCKMFGLTDDSKSSDYQ